MPWGTTASAGASLASSNGASFNETWVTKTVSLELTSV